ncbi:MAG: Argininosuccinate lyase [Verrucomicrobia bacterium]|nr:Argininosuccinate lyase [Verrucomicrobiota bacterium]
MHVRMILVALALLLGLPTLRGAEATTNKFNPARFEKEIVALENSAKTNQPPKNAIIFVGSSSIKKWTTLKQDFPKHKVVNHGFGGSVISDSVFFADRIVTPYKPKMVVMYAGDNDLGGGKTPEVVAADFKAFTEKVWAANKKTKIAYIAIKPSIKRWNLVDKVKEANSLIEAYCKSDKRLDFIDVFPAMLGTDGKPRPELLVEDGLHMTPEGYKLWTSIVKKHLP